MRSQRYGIGAVAVCGECGNLISLARVPAADGELWVHTGTGQSFCYRAAEHTQTAWPDPGPADTVELPEVIGFLVQCQICPQKAVTRAQHRDWICPRCTEVHRPSRVVADVVDCELGCGGTVDGRDCRFMDGHNGDCLPILDTHLVPVADLHVQCAFSTRPGLVAMSDCCAAPATCAVEAAPGVFYYRCDTHADLIRLNPNSGTGLIWDRGPTHSAVPAVATVAVDRDAVMSAIANIRWGDIDVAAAQPVDDDYPVGQVQC